jgi:hypothetical protein
LRKKRKRTEQKQYTIESRTRRTSDRRERERNEIRWNIFKSQAWKEGKKERERIRKKP